MVLDRTQLSRREIFKVVRGMSTGDAIVLNGALGFRDRWIDLLFAIYLRWFKRGVGVLVSDATWHPRTVADHSRAKTLFKLYAWFLKLLFRLSCSPHTHYCFLSRQEVDTVVREAGLPQNRVHFTPFCSQLPTPELDALHAIAREPHAPFVFSGGNSLRDYDTLIEAAQGSQGQFLLATNQAFDKVPANIVAGPLSEVEYFRKMAASEVVIVPLLPVDGRSVGQQTYLNALALGKPLIVTDTAGVRDHVEAGVHALVVPPKDSRAMGEAISWMLDPANRLARDQMAERGRALVAEQSFGHYAARLGELLVQVERGLNGRSALPENSALN